MLGLRTQESNEFINYFTFVQSEANKLNRVFFLDFGECDDKMFNDMEVDTLFGWLIPNEMVNIFKENFEKNKSLSNWDDYCIWVIPEIDGNKLNIEFE
ncbi:hypothetical protein [Anaerococcus porci]|uniref:hypothetical protein n=1 Tax=Anaerococcus porci TaxID=2652269 RepID=UPI002A751BBD|nr:hypothetical protein [Anaerococcus porci]MDY3007405.1 hypothetical protein [Anaerococcus porci]